MYEIYFEDCDNQYHKLTCYDETAAVDIAEQLSEIYRGNTSVEQGLTIIAEFDDGKRRIRN